MGEPGAAELEFELGDCVQLHLGYTDQCDAVRLVREPSGPIAWVLGCLQQAVIVELDLGYSLLIVVVLIGRPLEEVVATVQVLVEAGSALACETVSVAGQDEAAVELVAAAEQMAAAVEAAAVEP
jgi:hypothetical protein